MQAQPPTDPHSVLDCLVVGAGISGLATAFGLRQQGRKVQVIDAALRAGGVIASVRRGGFLYECGPNSALDTSPRIGELVQALGLQARLRWASEAANKRYVVRAGRLTALPMSPVEFLGTRLFSLRAKLGLLREPFVPAAPAQGEESIAAFVRRRLGNEFLNYAIDPFVAGIYAGDPEAISVQAAFPKLHALEQRWGSLIRGQVFGARERRRQKETAKNTAKSFSFAGGMQELTDALAAAVGPLALGQRAQRLERAADGLFTVWAESVGTPGQTQPWRARSVVLAVPAAAAATLLPDAATEATAALADIGYAPVATVASAYRRADIGHALDGFGCLIPRLEQRRALGVLFSSTMFDERAPAGHVLLTSFIGGQRQPALAAADDATVAGLAQDEHRALLAVERPPLFTVVTRWPRAIPQYNLGHLQRVARAQAAAQAVPGLYFCANWLGGVSVGDCIKNGHAAADSVAGYLGATAA